MMNFLLAVILLLLALLGVAVRKTYDAVPVRELKRRARQHDAEAAQFYRVVAYGSSLRALLWVYILVTSAASVLVLARIAPAWLSLPAILILIGLAFAWLPNSRVSSFSHWVTRLVTPLIAWLLNYLHPVLSRSSDMLNTRRPKAKHTGLFEREDVLNLIKRQAKQPDNRISGEELEIARRALGFSDLKVRDVLTLHKMLKSVRADDTIGPVLIDELHKTEQPYALVRETASVKSDVIGSLAINDLGIKSKGTVRSVMNPRVYYVHENDNLSTALHAFFVTNQPLFLVVDNAEDLVGVIAIGDIVKQLLGHIPGEDFDQYADRAAVAARHIRPAKAGEPVVESNEILETEETPVKTDDEVIE